MVQPADRRRDRADSQGVLSPLPVTFVRRLEEFIMRKVFSSMDSAAVGLAQSKLEAAGVLCEVRNDAVSQAIPAMPFATELWVVRDEDYDEARQLIGPDAPR